MSTYGCGVSHHVGFQSQGISSVGDADLLSTYSMLSATSFGGMASFKKHVLHCYKSFVPGSDIHHQFLAFTDVTQRRFNKIDALRDHDRDRGTSLPSMTVLYDAREEVLIVKIMPCIQHDAAAMAFHRQLDNKFLLHGVQRSIKLLGSGQFGDPYGRSKEADNAYRPHRRGSDDFPSLVVEVGVSESIRMFRNDARLWLTQSNGQTQIVILLHIDLVVRKIVIERWECVNDARPHRASVFYPPTIGMIQFLELVDGDQYTGAALDIPAIKVLDTVPNRLPPGEFRFTSTDLQAFSDDFWEN